MSTLSARLHIKAAADLLPAAPHTKPVGHSIENAAGGQGWRNGQASGQVDRVLLANGSLSSGGTTAYDLLAAGSLTDVLGQAIDADELKGIVIKCLTGNIEVTGDATNPIGFFKAGSDGINIPTGATFAMDFGDAGLDVTTDSKFSVTESTSAAAATYQIWLVVAQ